MSATAANLLEPALRPGRPAAAPRALVVRLAQRLLALPTGAGGRVVEVESCTRVPTGPEHLIGFANSQGFLLALVDVRPLLGLPMVPWSWPLRAQVVAEDRTQVAVAVDEVLGLGRLDDARLEPPGAELPASLRTFTAGMLEVPEGRAVVLDVPRVLEVLRTGSNREEEI